MWQIIFFFPDNNETQILLSGNPDPQQGATECRAQYEWLEGFHLVAAVKGEAEIMAADSARTAENGLQPTC